MQEEGSSLAWILIVILVIWIISSQSTIKKLKSENEDLQSQNDELQSEVSDYQDFLQQANTNIEDAQGEAWTSYSEMGQALENLETVSDPY